MSAASLKAYEQIKSMIQEGRVLPGERLKENDLTVLCGVSRTPVREALRRLAQEGMVQLIPNQGAQVAPIDADKLQDIYALRAMIEGYAGERAAVRISPAQIQRLRTISDELDAAFDKGHAAISAIFVPRNVEFHRIVLEAAESERLTQMAALVMDWPLRRQTLTKYTDEDLLRSLRQHRELIAAFEARDGAWAGAILRAHVHAALNALLRAQVVGSAAA